MLAVLVGRDGQQHHEEEHLAKAELATSDALSPPLPISLLRALNQGKTTSTHVSLSKSRVIDVKTTYRSNKNNTFSYTLGGYTSFIKIGNEQKNIVFPFNDYVRHLVIGFVYDRIARKKAGAIHKYTIEQLTDIPLPFENVEFFVQDKWRISSDRAGSGNTTNIGSINGTIDDFRMGNGPFHSEEEFLEENLENPLQAICSY